MSKLPYAFAAIALVLAFSDVRDTANNALTEREEGGLALLTSMIVGGGFAVRRLAARSCPPLRPARGPVGGALPRVRGRHAAPVTRAAAAPL